MVIEFLNEKGNVRVSVRSELAKRANDVLVQVLTNAGLNVKETARKTYAIELGTDQNGKPIYFEITSTITQKGLDEKPKTRPNKKKTVMPDIPKLFE